MDSLDNFSPTDTSGFIAIQSIRYVYQLTLPIEYLTDGGVGLQVEEVWSSKGRGGGESQPSMKGVCLRVWMRQRSLVHEIDVVLVNTL